MTKENTQHWNNDFFTEESKLFSLMTTIDKNIIEFLRKEGVSFTSTVLEQCCGNGFLLNHITEEIKCKTIGIDIIDSYINEAKDIAFNKRLKSRFLVDNILDKKSLCLAHFIINWNTSWSYFTDDVSNLAFFEHAHKNLKNNGKFILEFYNSNYVQNNFKEIRNEEYSKDNNNYKVIKKSKIDNKILTQHWDIYKNSELSFSNQGITKMYTPDEIREMLHSAGFQTINFYADTQHNPFCLINSPRVIISAQK